MDMATTHRPSHFNLNHNIASIRSRKPSRPTITHSNFTSSNNSTSCHRRFSHENDALQNSTLNQYQALRTTIHSARMGTLMYHSLQAPVAR